LYRNFSEIKHAIWMIVSKWICLFFYQSRYKNLLTWEPILTFQETEINWNVELHDILLSIKTCTFEWTSKTVLSTLWTTTAKILSGLIYWQNKKKSNKHIRGGLLKVKLIQNKPILFIQNNCIADLNVLGIFRWKTSYAKNKSSTLVACTTIIAMPWKRKVSENKVIIVNCIFYTNIFSHQSFKRITFVVG